MGSEFEKMFKTAVPRIVHLNRMLFVFFVQYLSEDPSLTACFFPGRDGMGEGDIQMFVVVDGPPES